MDAGVGSVIDLLTASLDEIERCVTFHPGIAASSHTVVIVSGLDAFEVPVAMGRYLVGTLAGAVGLDARLSEDLLARGVDRREEIRRTVTALIGTDNIFITEEQKQVRDTRRNAWIGEGIGHALLSLGARRETSCVDGRICTLSEMHQTVTRQGLDSVGTYVQNDVLGVSIGESKSTESNASANFGEALNLFSEVEEGIHGPDLRARLSAFRYILEPGLKEQVKDSLWSDNASYLPIVVYQDDYDFTTARPKFQRMKTPRERRRVIVVQLPSFHAFFDAVADAMRAAVDEVVV
ncbi:hypothetical protein GCM10010404_91820 [Nonomuraea africana]